jgi:hypothetical protein
MTAMAVRIGIWALGLVLSTAAVAGEEKVWLEVDRPENGRVELGMNPFLPVRGAAGTRGRGVFDLAVIVDISRSTKHGSGVDVNRDGHLGAVGPRHRRSWRGWLRHPQTSSDPGDSILSAEIEAVRRLIETLDPEWTRVALISLGDSAILRSGFTSSRADAMRALEHIGSEGPHGRTHMAAAIERAVQALGWGRRTAGPYRDMGILLISDGKPTVPSPDSRAEQLAVDAAIAARREGIRIYTVALGLSDEDSVALQRIASETHGHYVAVRDPGEIIEALPHLDLRGVPGVEIQNHTTGHQARSLQVWPDGAFDAYVEMAPGKNRLEITAIGPSGGRTTIERFVYYSRRAPRNMAERRLENRRLEQLRADLKRRRVRVELDREMDAVRAAQESNADRQLELELELETE